MHTNELVNRLDVAFAMRNSGNYAEALNGFENLDRESADAKDIAALRLFQTMCLTDLGRIDEALERINGVDENSLEIVDRIDYESEYARIRRAQGMIEEALERTTRALRMAVTVEDKRRVEVATKGLRTMLGILLAESGKCDDAMPALQEVSEDSPWWAEAKLHLGDCKYKKKLFREAIECYLSLVTDSKKVHPFFREAALRNIGYAYYDLGEYKDAVAYLKQVADAYDEAPDMKAELFRILASSYSRLEMPQESAKYSGFSLGSKSVQ